MIEIKNLEKSFKVLNRKEGLKGAFKNLFSYLPPVIGVLFFYVSCKVWIMAANKYSGTGS